MRLIDSDAAAAFAENCGATFVAKKATRQYGLSGGLDAVQGLRAQHIAVRAYPAVWKAGDADVPQQAFAMQQAQCWRERFLQLWRTEGVQKC